MTGPRIVRDRGRYLDVVLAKLEAEVRSAPEGGRNRSLNGAAWSWARLGGDEAGLERIGAAGMAAGLDPAEVTSTLGSARRGGAAAAIELVGGAPPKAPATSGRARRVTPARPMTGWGRRVTGRVTGLSEPLSPIQAVVPAGVECPRVTGDRVTAGPPPCADVREREAIRGEGREPSRPGLVGPVGRTYGPGLPPVHAEPLVLEAARLLEADLPGEGGW